MPKGATDVVAALAEWFPGLATDRASFQAAAAAPLRLEELGEPVHRVSPAAAASSSAGAAAAGDVVIYRTALAGASDYVKARATRSLSCANAATLPFVLLAKRPRNLGLGGFPRAWRGAQGSGLWTDCQRCRCPSPCRIPGLAVPGLSLKP